MVLGLIIIFLVGMLMGVSATLFIMPQLHDGVFKIDHSRDDKDIYRLEMNDLDNLNKRHYVVLKVDNNANLSHE